MKTSIGNNVKLRRKSSPPLTVGRGQPTRINSLLGISIPSKGYEEYHKLEVLQELGEERPDIVTDLSIIKKPKGKRLWERIIDRTPFVAATVPIYLTERKNGTINPSELLDIATEHMESGVGLITIHPTATEELVKLSSNRLIPCTSRSGGLVIADLVARNMLEENIYIKIFDDLLTIAKLTGTVISVGTTFRPACIYDALDTVHIKEIEVQAKFGLKIKAAGVDAIIEGPGHCRPTDIRKVAALLLKAEMPVMALGPLPLDSAIGQDHIAGTIGATLLGLEGCADILAIVTREEHTGGVPSAGSTIEAIKAAKIACKVIDLEILNNDQNEYRICKSRAISKSCIVGKGSPGCLRCNSQCPLRINELVFTQHPHAQGRS